MRCAHLASPFVMACHGNEEATFRGGELPPPLLQRRSAPPFRHPFHSDACQLLLFAPVLKAHYSTVTGGRVPFSGLPVKKNPRALCQ